MIIIKSNNDNTSSIVVLKQTFVVISKQAFVVISKLTNVVSKITNVVSKITNVVSKTTIVVSASLTNNKTINFRFNLRFKYRNDLIYFIIKNNHERFCISTSLKQKIFQFVYNQTHYNEFYKTYDRIVFFVYIY